MNIVKFYSGIGNQLFQYSIYLNIKNTYNSIPKIDITSFANDNVKNLGNGFPYGFAIPALFKNENFILATEKEIKRLNYKEFLPERFANFFPVLTKKLIHNRFLLESRVFLSRKVKNLKNTYITNSPFNSFNGNILNLDQNKDYFFDGLWQNYDYVISVEKHLFNNISNNFDLTFYYQKTFRLISSTNSVMIHVRRGNFIKVENRYSHDLCNPTYFRRAINIMTDKINNPSFFIFSDDIPYAKEILGIKENYFFIECQNQSELSEFFLMRNCKHAILPNSTFSWWARVLSFNKGIVIYPKYYVRNKNSWLELNSPKNWFCLDNLR